MSFGLLSSLTWAGGKVLGQPVLFWREGRRVDMAVVLSRGVGWPSVAPVCCLCCEICFSFWDLHHFPQKKEKCARDRATQRRPDVPHFLFMKKFKAIPIPGQNLEIAPGCAAITVPGKTNFSG